jgi:DNA-binding XRE family transcriptional regulator
MKSINVSSKNSEGAEAVWFDDRTGLLSVRFGTIVRSIPLFAIDIKDFDSPEEIERFSIINEGDTVVCHHADGEESWLPTDMWEPGGFTPKPTRRGRDHAKDLPDYSQKLIEARESVGLTQPQAAERAGISPRTYQQWEQGRQKPAADRLGAALGRIYASVHRYTITSTEDLVKEVRKSGFGSVTLKSPEKRVRKGSTSNIHIIAGSHQSSDHP